MPLTLNKAKTAAKLTTRQSNKKRPSKKEKVSVLSSKLDGGATAMFNLTQSYKNTGDTKGSVVVVSKPKVSKKNKPKKSKSTSRKQTSRKTKTVKTTSSKTNVRSRSQSKPAVKSVKKKSSAVKKPTKPRRVHNTKPTSFDVTGIGIGPARVKAVLVNTSLNPRESVVREAIMLAANKPKKPKPTVDDPEPETPEQGEQTAIEDLPADVLEVIHEAESAHEVSLRTNYERERVKNMGKDTPARKTDYIEKRKKARSNVGEDAEFDLVAFNKSFDVDFYNDWPAYLAEHDSYSVGEHKKKDGVFEYMDEWSRAKALVNKLCTRLSGNTRNIIASFLDCMVEQYAENGIYNCIQEDKHIVQLRHALTETPGFEKRVPLDKFVKTLENYGIAYDWIEECKNVRDEVKKCRAEGETVEFTLPEYPKFDHKYDFSGYVGEICRSVRMRLATKEEKEEVKGNYLSTSVSREFKTFCSYVVYETVIRLGAFLRATVERSKVKTISDEMVWYAIRQFHNVTGVNFTPIEETMKVRLDKFKEWRKKRKDARLTRRKKEEKKEEEKEENNESDEDEDEDEDNGDVHYDKD